MALEFYCIYRDSAGDLQVAYQTTNNQKVPRVFDTRETAFDDKKDEYPSDAIWIVKNQELSQSDTWTDPPIS